MLNNMIITDEKIKVTEQMMFEEGLSLYLISGQLRVPFSSTQKEPTTTKSISSLTEDDFDKIEEYFLLKQKARLKKSHTKERNTR